jgi:hypothetical protein
MDPARYNKVLSEASISNVMLKNLMASCFSESVEWTFAGTPEVNTQVRSEAKGDSFHLFQQFIAQYHSASDPEKAILFVSAEFSVVVRPRNVDEAEVLAEFIDEFQIRQLTLLTRPYFRELCASITSRAQIMAPTLPTHIIPPLVIEVEDSTDEVDLHIQDSSGPADGAPHS